MLRGNDIESFVELLIQRDVCLFHACQFLDFKSYLSLGGIPSRACLEKHHMPFTGFETDGHDHTKGVWDVAFMNFSDFGRTFANGGKSVPNPYGPILLLINPRALYEALDVAVCIQPVGGRNFISREKNSLKSIEAIDNLFVYPIGHPRSAEVKFRKALRQDYRCSDAVDPDISCTVTNGKLSFEYVSAVLVDPYIISGRPLRQWILEFTPPNDSHLRIQERFSHRKDLYNELAKLIAKSIPSCNALSQNPYVSDKLRKWTQEIELLNLDYQFKRFATYLRDGTLLQLL